MKKILPDAKSPDESHKITVFQTRRRLHGSILFPVIVWGAGSAFGLRIKEAVVGQGDVMRAIGRYFAFVVLAAMLAGAVMAQEVPATRKPVAANAVRAGAFFTERPTLLSLGFSWKISGDENRNSTVAVRYRRAGESAWRPGLPLFRMGGEFIAGPKPMFGGLNYYDYRVQPAFAGSVLNLQPDTTYDVHFVLRDPDGVIGAAEKTVRVKTRKEPAPAPGGRVFHAWPFTTRRRWARTTLSACSRPIMWVRIPATMPMSSRCASVPATRSWSMRGSTRITVSSMAASTAASKITALRMTAPIISPPRARPTGRS
jgi:hypothetical protein